MNRSRYPNQRRSRSRDAIERRMDQLVETGKQLVDGVAGNRPGQRSKDNRYALNNMGRWVGQKIDWFFEEEEWSESTKPLNDVDMIDNIPMKKRPLKAISLRVPKMIQGEPASVRDHITDPELTEEWPDDSAFTVDRWQRGRSKRTGFKEPKSISQNDKTDNKRSLPRSSRRRY
ncbi:MULTISPECIES: hypothetical protein [unclassified Prochlorococcus]|uniref:hypothetical protein n=1 Tax=unclassified Prochlorococcus TaxID=2627481 RepID=UPI00056B1D33|nr:MULTISPECIES: hypothetical protein [unclassified Prochlorococcus]